MSSKNKIAVVTGANRGIGFEIARQLAEKNIEVILTARDKAKGEEACRKLQRDELPVRFFNLNVDHGADIGELRDFVKHEYGRCDILVNNAGIFPDTGDNSFNVVPSILDAKLETIQKGLLTNVFGPLMLSQALVPLMQKNKYGRIVNLSSGMGQLSEMNGGYPAYRISKTAINALTRILNDELAEFNILVNSMCPGWVKTDMGGPNATRSVKEGADTAVWLATLPDNGPRGKFFRDRKEIPW